MKTNNLLYTTFIGLTFICLFCHCKSKISNATINKILYDTYPSYLVFGEDSLMIISSQDNRFASTIKLDYSHKYLLPYDGMPIDINVNGLNAISKRKEYKVNLVVDTLLESEIGRLDSFVNDLNFQLDSILKKLYVGYSTRIDKYRYSSLNIETNGKINADNIKQSLLEKSSSGEKQPPIYIVLCAKGDFLNTANAVCIETKNSDIILGDGKIFQNPFLLLHEIFHALELRHVVEQNCGVPGNIMDYRTIGCSHYILPRQILHMSFDKYILPIKDSLSFPNCHDCATYSQYNSFAENYTNSIDNEVVELPINGDHALLLRYKDELITGKMSSDMEDKFRKNYIAEAKIFGFDTLAYSDKMVDIHNTLRQKNLSRWLKSNFKSLNGVELTDSNYNEGLLSYFYAIKGYDKISVSEENFAISEPNPRPNPEPNPRPNPEPDPKPDSINGQVPIRRFK